VKDALARGGEIVCGGDFVRRSDGGFSLAPTLLRIDDVRARIFREEVFGPLAAIAEVEDADAALDLMHRCYQALGVSLWTKNLRTAAALARRTPAGMTWVNDAAYGLPNLPWQGWGEAGRGLFLSADALTAVTRLRWVSAHPAFPARPRLWWQPYRPWKKRLFGLLARWM
jgi:acyl-CoA reductase-like NAD-dependent aldehyde dehydrogenase